MQVFIDLRVIISVTLRYGSTTYEEYLPAQHAEVVNSAGTGVVGVAGAYLLYQCSLRITCT